MGRDADRHRRGRRRLRPRDRRRARRSSRASRRSCRSAATATGPPPSLARQPAGSLRRRLLPSRRRMLPVLLALLLGAVLAGSALLKLADGPRTRAALGTYGIRGEPLPRAVWGGLIAVELVLAVAVVAGVEAAAWAGAALFAGFARRAGRGARSRGARARRARASARAGGSAAPRSGAPARSRRVRGAAAARPRASRRPRAGSRSGSPPRCSASPRSASRCSRSRASSGALRAEIDPRGALEIPEEGPELGGRSELMEVEPGRLGLAVFTSEGCGMCRALEPAIEALGRDPLVRLQDVRRGPRRPRLGGRRHPRVARSRSRSTSTAPCSPRARSTPPASSSRCSRPRSGGAHERVPARLPRQGQRHADGGHGRARPRPR